MNFETKVIWLAKVYKILEKFKLEENFPLDYFIDNNYPQFLSRLQSFARYYKIAICATNGKRTTANFLNHILFLLFSVFE